MSESLHPYVVLLPSTEKTKTLSAIFGSKAAVDVLRFSLKKGISNRIYQKDLVRELHYSNKTIIENLKSLTNLRVLTETMEKGTEGGRTVWMKAYQLSNAGKWFALLLAEEKELSDKEKRDILQSLFRTYVKWARDLSEKLGLDKKVLGRIFAEELGRGSK